jgi:hypothetical protein
VHAGAEYGDDDDDQHKEGKRHGNVNNAHQHSIEPAAVITRQGAEHDAIGQRHVSGEESDLHVDANAVEDTGEDVAPEHVRPERMSPTRGLQRIQQILVIGVIRSEPRSEHTREHDQGEDTGADLERNRPVPNFFNQLLQEAPAEGRRICQACHFLSTRRSTRM